MRGFWPLLKRELFAYFVTPLAWVLVSVFLIVQGLHFYVLVEQLSTQVGASGDVSPVSAFFGNTILLYLVLFLLVPAMTMRLFAEERRSGTAEALLTAPVSTTAVVLSKYVAVLVVYVVMWAPTTLYLVILRRTGALDVHVAASSYLGVLLVGAAYLATGLLTSAMTKSQLIALVLSALVILVLFLLGVGELVAREGTAMHAVCNHVSVWAAMSDFSSGIVDTRRLVFYGTLTVVPLYFTVRVVDAWRWG